MCDQIEHGVDPCEFIEEDDVSNTGLVKLMPVVLLIILVLPMISIAAKVLIRYSDLFPEFQGTPTPAVIKDLLFF